MSRQTLRGKIRERVLLAHAVGGSFGTMIHAVDKR
jgi:hypothetical protein